MKISWLRWKSLKKIDSLEPEIYIFNMFFHRYENTLIYIAYDAHKCAQIVNMRRQQVHIDDSSKFWVN
jgi:hypothetical protein